MPAPRDVNRESVKTLAIAVGVREAARQLNIPEATVQSWSLRGAWFKQAAQTPLPPTVTPIAATNATTASKALQNVLDGAKYKSKALLAKYVVNASKVAARSRSPLRDAQDVRHVAAVHSTLWPEAKAGTGGLTLNLGVAIGNME